MDGVFGLAYIFGSILGKVVEIINHQLIIEWSINEYVHVYTQTCLYICICVYICVHVDKTSKKIQYIQIKQQHLTSSSEAISIVQLGGLYYTKLQIYRGLLEAGVKLYGRNISHRIDEGTTSPSNHPRKNKMWMSQDGTPQHIHIISFISFYHNNIYIYMYAYIKKSIYMHVYIYM